MNKNESSNESINQNNSSVGEMQKRAVTMPDGKRYLIYYTFEKTELAITDLIGDSDKSS